jgi:hypothetical protein
MLGKHRRMLGIIWEEDVMTKIGKRKYEDGKIRRWDGRKLKGFWKKDESKMGEE